MCILFCKSIRYDLIGYISLIIKLNILNHLMILASVDYSYKIKQNMFNVKMWKDIKMVMKS